MSKEIIAALAALTLVTACGDDEETEATETIETAAEPTTPAAPEPAPEPEAPAPGERVDATVAENHLPTQVASAVTVPTGDAAEIGLIQVTMADATSITASGGGGDEGERFTVEGAAAATAAYTHNPAGDSGEDCPTLDAARTAIGQAEVVTEQRLASMWEGEGPAYGDEMDLLIFQSGDQAGFFVRKRFDHGDDYTDFCVASGTPQAPVTNMTLDQAKALAGAFMTARENL